MEKENSTTNALLIIILVIIVGAVVWYIAKHYSGQPAAAPSAPSTIQVNVPTSSAAPAPSGSAGASGSY